MLKLSSISCSRAISSTHNFSTKWQMPGQQISLHEHFGTTAYQRHSSLSSPSLQVPLSLQQEMKAISCASQFGHICRSMPQYADSSFEAVLDKGTMDAMACGEHAAADIHDFFTESSRQVSDAQLLQHLTCLLTHCTIGKYTESYRRCSKHIMQGLNTWWRVSRNQLWQPKVSFALLHVPRLWVGHGAVYH